MSQKNDILAALKRGDKLTRDDISARFDCRKGPARISDLRAEGIAIRTETLHWETVHGVKKSCALWSLDKSGQLGLGV